MWTEIDSIELDYDYTTDTITYKDMDLNDQNFGSIIRRSMRREREDTQFLIQIVKHL